MAAARGQRLGIDLYAERGSLRTSDADEADAPDTCEIFCSKNILRVSVDNSQRQAVRGDAQNQNRCVC